jgi:hypothetical protein
MASRKRLVHSELVRERIRTSALVTFLTNYALGRLKKQVDPARVTAALGVLRKALPDLQAIEHLGEIEHRHHVVSAEPLSEEAWQTTYGNAGQALNG